MYNAVTPAIVEALRQIAGQANILVDEEALEPYTHDETVGLRAVPEVVVKVASAEQVAKVFRLAQQERIAVTPRGAGYGLSGGAVALHGGIVLSTEKMNRILEIDHQNLMVTVEPGVITGDIHRAVEAEGLFYPPDPASLDSCTIGGNVAEGAGGPRAVKYGVTKDYVCGLEAVLPSGEVITCGGKLVKNATGYSLGTTFAPNWMDWPMFYHGNPLTTFRQPLIRCQTSLPIASCPPRSSSWNRTASWPWSDCWKRRCLSAMRPLTC